MEHDHTAGTREDRIEIRIGGRVLDAARRFRVAFFHSRNLPHRQHVHLLTQDEMARGHVPGVVATFIEVSD